MQTSMSGLRASISWGIGSPGSGVTSRRRRWFGVARLAPDLTRSTGGRGHRSPNPYARVTVSLPPDLLALLDQYATVGDVTRSAALAQIIYRHVRVWPPMLIHEDLK